MKKSLIVGAICALLASAVVGYADQEAQQTLKLHTAPQPYTGDDYIKMERGGAMWKIPANTLGSGGGGGSTLPGGSSGQIQTNVGGATFGGSNLTTLIDLAFGSTQGDILYRDASGWSALLPGASGQFLKTQGAAANPAWATVTGGSGCATTGSATNIITDNGSGGCSSSPFGLLSNIALNLGANGGQGGRVVLFGSTSGSSTIQVPAAAGTGSLFELPNTNGSPNQVLKTDGSGHTSWVNAGAGSVTAPTSLATHYPVIGGANGTTDVKTIASPLINGQTLCGSTGADPVACTPTGTNGAVVSGGAGTINVSVTGTAVDNGAVTPATVTTTGTTAATTRRENIGTLGASITRTLPLISTGGIYTTGLAPDSMVCYDDLGVNVTASHTLTVLPNATNTINGGTAGTGVGVWTSLTENCFRVAGLTNWVQADGVPTSNAPAGSAATGLGVNGLIYDTLTTIMDSALGAVQGSVIYRNASVWTALGPGTSGQVLQSAGAAANPVWATPASSVSITAATSNIVVTPSPLTGTGTIGTTLVHNAPADGGSHSYTVLSSDLAKEVDLVSTFTAAVVPQATGSFASGVSFALCNAGAITATSTTSTINGIAGATGLKLGANGCSEWSSDGTNWKVAIGAPTPATQNNTTVVATDGSIITPATGSAVAPIPQGRLTLVTGVPVMASDQSAKTTIFYDSYAGNLYPNWNGSAMANITITSDEISMGLDAGSHIVSATIYDVFGTAGAAMCAGPAWTSLTGRGTGAGTTELQLKSGVYTNKNALTNCWGGASGVTNLGSIAANQGTYLGSFYATANGQTSMIFTPTAAAGGNNSTLGLWNAYNRVMTHSESTDSNTVYSYTTNVARAMDNSTSNRVRWIDGLSQSTIQGSLVVSVAGGLSTSIGIDSTTDQTRATSSCSLGTAFVPCSEASVIGSPPLPGFHFLQAIENGGTNGEVYPGGSIGASTKLTINLEM